MVQHLRRELDVVVDEIALRDADLGEEDLVAIRDPDGAPADLHGATVATRLVL